MDMNFEEYETPSEFLYIVNDSYRQSLPSLSVIISVFDSLLEIISPCF